MNTGPPEVLIIKEFHYNIWFCNTPFCNYVDIGELIVMVQVSFGEAKKLLTF